MIQRIEHFCAELQVETFSQPERLVCRKVQRDQSRPDQRVSPQVAVSTRRREREGRRVELWIADELYIRETTFYIIHLHSLAVTKWRAP